MKRIRFILLIPALALACGCAQLPPQSVELSTTLGNDLQVLQRSHRRSIELLFDRESERIEEYVTGVVIPHYVNAGLRAVGEDLGRDLGQALAPGAPDAARARAYENMRVLVVSISARVERQRLKLLAPLQDERKRRLHELDMAYAQMQQANSVVTGHLASIAKVHVVQDELLRKAGLPAFREKVGEQAVELGERMDDLLQKARDADDAAEKIKSLFRKVP